MTKADCLYYYTAYTTASNGGKQIKVWWCKEFPEKGKNQDFYVMHYFLDNGAECTDLIFEQDGKLWYRGGGWLETLLGKSFKGTSEDVDKIQKWIIYIALAAAVLVLVSPAIYKLVKQIKTKQQ